MFDLFRSREKTVRYLLGALLVLVAISMLTYLIPNYDMGVTADNPVVAEVGGDKVTVRDVQLAIRNVSRGRQLSPEVMAEFVPQIVQQLVSERALAFEAKRMGLDVTDADVADAIRATVPGLFQDGKFVGKDVYAAMLSQQNMSIQDFESAMARNVLVKRLRDLAVGGSFVSPIDVEQEYVRRNTKVVFDYVKFTVDQFKGKVSATPEEVRQSYEATKGSYQSAEKRNLKLLVLDQAKLAAAMPSTDADIQRYYDQNKDRFRTPERVKVRHILLSTVGKSSDEEAKIKAKAEDLLKQIKGGGDFAELAKKNSEDPGSATKGGDLDWVVKGQTVPEFEKTAFSLKPKELSGLVKTQYGYHILQTMEKEEARLKPMAEVRDQIVTDMNRAKVNEIMQSAADRGYEALQKNKDPEAVAKQFNMDVVAVENAARGAEYGSLGASPELDNAAFQGVPGEPAQPVLLGGNKLVIPFVASVTPPKPQPFEEVQAQVRDKLLRQKQEQMMQAKATELGEKVKAMNGDLRAAAKAMGAEVKTTQPVTRLTDIEGLGPANYLYEGFVKPVGAVVGPTNFTDGRGVAKSVSKQEPTMDGLNAQRAEIVRELKTRREQEEAAMFEDGLRDRLTKEGKIKVDQDAVKRIAQSYRG